MLLPLILDRAVVIDTPEARRLEFLNMRTGDGVAAEVENATLVTIICDRGDRYLSTGVFPD